MQEKIRDNWDSLKGSYKRKLLLKWMEEFNNVSENAMRSNWIYKHSIPIKYHEKAYKISKEVLNEQIKSMEVLVS